MHILKKKTTLFTIYKSFFLDTQMYFCCINKYKKKCCFF